ncbi:MAG TPA: DegT/DnrJ/EryC1/StrS family aminotransferase [Gemmatimonadaceae bacterium]|nr:DegT/DnrJ/EryC1/StrS family aminotransferase [Gemmatimonadaceae bacterium]
MTLRRQLPVHSPVRMPDVARAAAVTATGRVPDRQELESRLARHFGAHDALLTDSGTSALVLALRLTAAPRAPVAFPAYGCVDLVAAAIEAGVRVRLYDVDPSTLSPDLASLRAACVRGVEAVVVAHLYGYPADVAGAALVAADFGVPVIEDAAQGIGGALHGQPLGSFGDLTVLSFGRGKGVTCGGGGALLAASDAWADVIRAAEDLLVSPAQGWAPLASLAAQWALGRPSVYAIPCAIPGLRLGEMVYRPAHEPRAMSNAAVRMLRAAWDEVDDAVERRRANGFTLTTLARNARSVRPIRVVSGGTPGFLRMAVLDAGARSPAPALGIVRPYPRALHDMSELWPIVAPGGRRHPGADELVRSLFTLPTHEWVDERDLAACERWLNEPRLRMIGTSTPVSTYRRSEVGVP